MMAETEALGKLLFELEKQLMDAEFRRDRKRVSSLLHQDFREFGASGRVWSREAILDLLHMEPTYPSPDIVDFNVVGIVPTAALVTYCAVRGSSSSLRSSVWVKDGGEWRILFHQGTKVP